MLTVSRSMLFYAIHHIFLSLLLAINALDPVRRHEFAGCEGMSVISNKPGTSVDSWGHVSFLGPTRSFGDPRSAVGGPAGARLSLNGGWLIRIGHWLVTELRQISHPARRPTDWNGQFSVVVRRPVSRRPATDGRVLVRSIGDNRYWGIDLS